MLSRGVASARSITVLAAGLSLLIAAELPAATAKSRTKSKTQLAREAVQRPLGVDPAFPLDHRRLLLAEELQRMWTRDADRLVYVVSQALPDGSSNQLPMLLAIAHAETNGRILLVSEAGAAGLAQATPIAYLTEGLQGRLFVTPDYLTGAEAYFLKKPLNDAEKIAEYVAEGGDRDFALELLYSAFKLRREGIPELEVLAPFGGAAYLDRVHRRDAHNLAVLEELEILFTRRAEKAALTRFAVRTRDEYRTMRDIQKVAWKQYQQDLVSERDKVLREEFGQDPEAIIRDRAYEACEVLARELDDRFSPYSMASFLVAHLQTKIDEAKELGVPSDELERITAGLYNGGGHNIKRMRTGLINYLPETQNYMKKVPETSRRLQQVLSRPEPNEPASAE